MMQNTRILIADDHKEIAFDLQVREGTVKAHVSQILSKLGVSSRTQAALVVGRFGAAM